MPPPAPRQPSIRAVAASLGVAGPLDEDALKDVWTSEPLPGERAALESLRVGADLRLDRAYVNADGPSHLRTALNWLRRFLQAFPARRLFVPHRVSGDVRAAAYNEETFRLFAEFIRRSGSARAGAEGSVISAATIADYVSALRAWRSREAGYSLSVPGGNLRYPKQLQQMRREDGPSGQRHLSRALTARLLRKLCRIRSFDTTSRRGVLRWAVLWGGHNLLLRGGEFGRTDRRNFEPAVGITIADLDWVAPCAESKGFEAVSVDVMPIKDGTATRSRVPCLIRRRSGDSRSVVGHERSVCAWDALRRLWLLRVSEVPSGCLGVAPFFAWPNGDALSTADVLTFIREAAEAVGECPSEFDARALRVAGATDLYHLFGPGQAEQLIQKRGRWCSEIHQIYTRMSATRMLDVSASMADAEGVDLEAFCFGYVMPAVVRRSSR